MVIKCRPSSISHYVVEWDKFVAKTDRLGRICGKGIVKQYKEFDTFADANGFAFSLIKRNVKGVVIIPVD